MLLVYVFLYGLSYVLFLESLFVGKLQVFALTQNSVRYQINYLCYKRLCHYLNLSIVISRSYRLKL